MFPNKSNWLATLTDKPRVCPHVHSDGENVTVVSLEEVMASTYELSEFLPQFLVDTSNVSKEV